MPVAVQKVCAVCGKDVSGEKRTKDARGRYFCQPCYSSAAARTASATTAEAAGRVTGSSGPSTGPSSPGLPPHDSVGAGPAAGSAPAQPGSRPAARPTPRKVIAPAKWAALLVVVVVAYVVLLTGTRLLPASDDRGEGVGFAVLAAFVCLIALIPSSIALTGRAVALAFTSRTAWVRLTAVLAAVLLVSGMVFAWPRLAETYDVLSTGSGTAATFADLDNQFGVGALTTNPQQLAKTSQQLQDDATRMLGRRFSGTGMVADVQDGQVLLVMKKSSLKNEVAMIPAW